MSEQKLILLYGFAGIGKSTVAERYAHDNPLALSLESDKLVTMVGQWREHEPEAWELVFKMSQAMVGTCIESGHDVVIPFMPRGADQLAGYEQTAREVGARFIEVCLTADRDEAIERLIKRGEWGEEGAPPITEDDRPVINELYDGMETALATRPDIIHIPSIENDLDGTYQRFLEAIS
jgi:predicted kinase